VLNYRTKTPIKLISLMLAQVFLLTGVVYPESTTNKNTSSIYIQAKDLRVPMMGAGNQDRLKQAMDVAQSGEGLSQGVVDNLVNQFQSQAYLNDLEAPANELVRIAGESGRAAYLVSERILSRFTPGVNDIVATYLATILGRIVSDHEQMTLIVVNAIASTMTYGEDQRIDDYLKNSLEDISMASDMAYSLVKKMQRAYSILDGMKGLSKDEALRLKIKPYLIGGGHTMLSIGSKSNGFRIVMSHQLLEEGLLQDDELEAAFLHEIIHAERGDINKWPEIVRMTGAEEEVRDIELEVDRLATERLFNKGKDATAVIRSLEKSEYVQEQLIKEGYLAPGQDSKGAPILAIPTPPNDERIQNIENYLTIRNARTALMRGNFNEAMELTQKVISSYLTIRNGVNEKFPLWKRITDEKLPEARQLLKETQVEIIRTVVRDTRSELKKILNTPDLTPAEVQDACGVASALGVKIFKDSAPQDTGKTLHQAFTIFDGHKHAFVVVGYPGRNYYLIDVTFAQFFNEGRAGFEGEPITILKEMENAGHPEYATWSHMAGNLISEGFIELNDAAANMYGTLLRGKYPSSSLSFNVDDIVNSELEEPDFTDRELENYASGIDAQTGQVLSPETFVVFLKGFFTGKAITAKKTGEKYVLIPRIAKDTPGLLQVYLENSNGMVSEEPVYRFFASTLEVSIDLDAINFGDGGLVSLTDQKLGTQLQKIFSRAVPAGFIVRGVVVNKETRENIFDKFEVKYDFNQEGEKIRYVSTRKGGLRVVDKNPGPGQVLLNDIIGRETLLGRLFSEANFSILKIASYITGEARKEGTEALLQLLGNTEHPQALFIRNAAGQPFSQFLETLQMSNPEVLTENITFFNRITGKVETMSFGEFLKILKSPKKAGIFISPETQEYLEQLGSTGLVALPEEMLKWIPDAKALGLENSDDKIAKFLETLSTPAGLRRCIAGPYEAELKIMLAQKQRPENKKQFEVLMRKVSNYQYQALMLLIIYRWDLQITIPVFGLSFVKTRDAVIAAPMEIRTQI